MNGCFITLEGSEGSGKTTCLHFIQQWLTEHQYDHILTREPGGTPLAEQLRSLLLQPEHNEPVDTLTELLMMFAARNQHCKHIIQPALQQNKIVVSDRFTDTTWAYQGAGRHMNTQWIQQLETMVQGTLRPNLTLLLDMPAELGLKRAKKRGNLDRFERETLDFFNRVREAYLVRAKQYQHIYRILDATKPLADIQTQIQTYLIDYFT
ncbi:MAG: dTMP kinase [Endozoicomonadaceae bacterium]|nr:dTMP kinase [Endozoicomonadaceae bacterium]